MMSCIYCIDLKGWCCNFEGRIPAFSIGNLYYCSVLNQLLISQFASTIDAFLFLSLIDHKIKINLHLRYILVMILTQPFSAPICQLFCASF